MKYVEIVNLERHQHYKNRNIHAWIKVELKMLSSESIHNLCEVDRWRYIALMMLATQRENKLKCNPRWLQNAIADNTIPSVRPMEETIDALEQEHLIRTYEEEEKNVPHKKEIRNKLLS